MGTCCSNCQKHLADVEILDNTTPPKPTDPLMRSVDGMYMDVGLIDEKQFTTWARSGDILLFHTNKASASIQRTLLWTDIDHVAVIVRAETKDKTIFVFEAVGG